VLFHQIGLERALSSASGRGDGTKAATVSMPLSGHTVSKWGAATATPVVVAPVATTLGATPSTPALLVPLLVLSLISGVRWGTRDG
jgi:hypothetical protein